MRLKGIVFVFLIFFAIESAVADGGKSTKVVGATVGDFANIAREILKPLLEKRGYRVRVVEFTDYVQPNIALAEGSLDLNIFQHKPYLEQFMKSRKLAFEPIAQVPTAPIAIYPGRAKSLQEIKDGASIAVPNDPTNLARALKILADVGWIELPEKIDAFQITPGDIKKNKKNLKIVQLEAAQIPRALADVDFAIINGNYVVSAGLSLSSALAKEKSDLYVNWAVVRAEDAKTPFAQAVRESLNSKEFKAYAAEKFKGYLFPKSWN